MKLFTVAASVMLVSGIAIAKTTLTRENGAPVGDNQNSQTAGETGPVLLQDTHLVEKLARFDRERTPERVVHARGTGAYGQFVSAADNSAITRADLFSKKGKKTKVFVRFSSVIHPSGSPETLRDPRGFATKFYTEEGNWDLVGNNLPVFFIRDAMKFPDMVHSLKPSPVTNIQDPNRFFDFFAHVPESINMLTYVYSDLGTPASYREMDGNGVHAYKFVNKKGEVTYVKFHWKSLNGIKNLSDDEVAKMQGKNFNHMTDDLYSSIRAKKFPSWELEAQLLKPEELNNFDFNPLDATKEWVRIPGLKVVKLGTMTLNEVPENFFEHTEQAALAPSNIVPGIEASEDRLLQGRMFSYADTQRYRIGVNALQLPVNRPLNVNSHGQQGHMNGKITKGEVNYQPNSFNGNPDRAEGIYSQADGFKQSSLPLSGATQQQMIKKTLNFRQAGETYRSFSEKERAALINNFAGDLLAVKNIKIRNQIVAHTYAADTEYGERLAKAAKADLPEVKRIASALNDDTKKVAAQ
ncbi:catalase [Bdellovibrio sp. SKB1291214]|uniref:catalase n=1 Tax=Bdellovibrio sp. SKB1291214 TaxID=1732569 RepID=UPI000B519B50|nr:catalase [Bdellovibrio sp. SKB1291214]